MKRVIFFAIAIVMAMTAVAFAETDEDIGQLYWIQGETIQDADTGRTYMYSDLNLELDSKNKIISEGRLHVYDDPGLTVGSNPRHGFFAIKEGEDYYAVESVSYAKGDESIVKLYQTDGTKHYSLYPCQVGKCSFQVELDGKVYEMCCNVDLINTETLNLFQHANPTENNLITSDIRFSEMAEQNEEIGRAHV